MDRTAKSRGAIAEPRGEPYIASMSDNRRPIQWTQLAPVRYALVALGFLLIASTPIVGPIPGPGGIVVFAAGLSLILKYTGWAKRFYVRLKRKHPNKGRWADWSLRRASARRREEIRKQGQAEN
jgi:hypothetical protein